MDVFDHFASKIIDPSFVAYGKRIPHGTNFACATCDYLLIEALGSRGKKKTFKHAFEGFLFSHSHSIVAEGLGDIS